MQTGDAGLAWAEPVVEVRKPDGQHILYGHVTADKAEAFAKAAADGRREGSRRSASSPGAADGVPMLADLDWAKIAGPLAHAQLRRHRPRQHRPLHRARRLLRTTWPHRRWTATR